MNSWLKHLIFFIKYMGLYMPTLLRAIGNKNLAVYSFPSRILEVMCEQETCDTMQQSVTLSLPSLGVVMKIPFFDKCLQ